MNESEKIVSDICNHSFLSFWSFPNPIREDDSKELTDLLVINDPFIIIISVKEINIKDSGDKQVDNNRWFNRAIEKSYKQIYGAERAIISKVTEILTSDKKYKIKIPNIETSKIYRLGISIGRKEGFALPFGEFESGFVHFFDQRSFPVLLRELDTITDFINYLDAKERFFTSGQTIRFNSEEDILALYLHRGRKFTSELNELTVPPFIWDEFVSKPGFLKRKEQERESYLWDRIIEEFFEDQSKEELVFNNDFWEIESSLRTMSKETRFSRMVLSKIFLDIVGFDKPSEVEARFLTSDNGVTYVYLVDEHRETNRDFRKQKLELRCRIARNLIDNNEVVGIAINRYVRGAGHSYDLCYINILELSDEDREKLKFIQNDLEYFTNSVYTDVHYDEYPE